MSDPLHAPRAATSPDRKVFAESSPSWPARAAEQAVALYQKTFSPVLAALAPTCGCRFAPTCSHYAREALREHGLFTGLAFSIRRILKCGPWHPGGLDPVPPRPLRSLSCTAVRPQA